MIFPEPRKDRLLQQGVAFVSTLIFAVLGFVFLSISQLEIAKTSREVFRRIDMTDLMPQSLRLGHVDVADRDIGSVQLIAEGNRRQSSNSEAQDVVMNDDGDLSENGETGAGIEGSGAQNETVAANQEQAQSEQPRQPPVTSQTTEEKSPPPQISSTPRQSNTPDSPTISPQIAGAGIPKLPLDSFGRDYKNLDVRQIIGWMKNNPSELPKGVRQLVRYRPAFLSSVTTFDMEGKQYELYLMCKESLFEVHVVLVEQNEATYLVDRSFQKLSTYLRKGQVRRTQDNQIIAVRSNMATNDSSDEFYSLFLSWWEWAQKNQGA